VIRPSQCIPMIACLLEGSARRICGVGSSSSRALSQSLWLRMCQASRICCDETAGHCTLTSEIIWKSSSSVGRWPMASSTCRNSQTSIVPARQGYKVSNTYDCLVSSGLQATYRFCLDQMPGMLPDTRRSPLESGPWHLTEQGTIGPVPFSEPPGLRLSN
jgi:hypothetical protein